MCPLYWFSSFSWLLWELFPYIGNTFEPLCIFAWKTFWSCVIHGRNWISLQAEICYYGFGSLVLKFNINHLIRMNCRPFVLREITLVMSIISSRSCFLVLCMNLILEFLSTEIRFLSANSNSMTISVTFVLCRLLIYFYFSFRCCRPPYILYKFHRTISTQTILRNSILERICPICFVLELSITYIHW